MPHKKPTENEKAETHGTVPMDLRFSFLVRKKNASHSIQTASYTMIISASASITVSRSWATSRDTASPALPP